MAVQLHCTVRGLVQGVGYRYFVQRKANELGLGGWVRNLADGSVEVLAIGNREQLEVLLTSLRHGPRSAIVQNVLQEWSEAGAAQAQFDIR